MNTNQDHQLHLKEIDEKEFDVDAMLARLESLNSDEWVEQFEALAIQLKKRPNWAKSDQRIDEHVSSIVSKLISSIVFEK